MADATPLPVREQELLDLINQDNNTHLTFDDVSISVPLATNFNGRNTQVTVSAKAGSIYVGNCDMYYNRLALSALGPVGILSTTALTVDQILASIKADKGIELFADELETIAIPVLEFGTDTTIDLIAKTTAVKWYGQVQVGYAFDLRPMLDNFHQFIHVTLPAPGYL